MAKLNIDTNLIRDCKQLQRQIQDRCEPTEAGCLLYPDFTISVRVQGYRDLVGISVARVAWALAHPEDHLGVHDFAVHICLFGTQATIDEPRACCNVEHIRKGTFADVHAMVRARRRNLVLRGGQ